jgi:hypothetical protein
VVLNAWTIRSTLLPSPGEPALMRLTQHRNVCPNDPSLSARKGAAPMSVYHRHDFDAPKLCELRAGDRARPQSDGAGAARTMVLLLVSAISLFAGLTLVLRFVTPTTIFQLRTTELLGVLGLIMLPWLTLWAMHAEARAAEFESKSRSQTGPTAAGSSAPTSSPASLGSTIDDADRSQRAAAEDGTRSVRSWAHAAPLPLASAIASDAASALDGPAGMTTPAKAGPRSTDRRSSAA